ncbi:MAG: hypothetical protein HY291_23715 [Planctomycetes bacterium]|nr:hypothetical protein [Planctomycetota bacterium]
MADSPIEDSGVSLDFTREEVDAANAACRHWRTALILQLFCGYLSLVWQIMACHHLYKARQTLRTPILVGLLALAWPGFNLAFYGLSWTGFRLPLQIVCGAYVTHLVLTFFIVLAIFRQWASRFQRVELDQLVGKWERAAMLSRFPVAAIYVWILTISLSEGWDFREFRWPTLSQFEGFGFGIAAVGLAGLALWTLVLEYQILKRFEDRCWHKAGATSAGRGLRPPAYKNRAQTAPFDEGQRKDNFKP